MLQNTSSIQNYFNNKIIIHEQQIHNFNNNLKYDDIPAKLNVVQFERLLQEIENTPSALDEGTRKQFKIKVISLKNDFTQKLLSTAQTLFDMEAEGIVEEDAPIKAKRLLAMANHSLDAQKISPDLGNKLRQIARDLVDFIEKHQPKPTLDQSSSHIQSHAIPSRKPEPTHEIVPPSNADKVKERILQQMDASECNTNFEDDFDVRIESLKDTLNRWDILLSRKALAPRLDFRNFDTLFAMADKANNGSEEGMITSSIRYDQAEQLKREFQKLFLNSLQNTANLPLDKADELFKIATHSLQAKTLLSDFRKELEKALLALNHIIQASNKPSSQVLAKANPTGNPATSPIGTLPDEVILRFMSLLGVKELGRMAQVSKAFYAAANDEGIWEIKCRIQPDDVDMTNLSANKNSYKLLYKNETDLSRFLKKTSLMFFKNSNSKIQPGVTVETSMDWSHPKLQFKHVKQIIKKTVLQNPKDWAGLIDADTPPSNIRIIFAGKDLNDEMLVAPLGLTAQSTPQFIVRESLNSIDYDNVAAAINQSTKPNTISKEILETFSKRGGHVQMWQEGKRIALNKHDQFITGCSSGVNRSQVTRAFLLNKGCNVRAPLAGGDSGANPLATYPLFNGVYCDGTGWDQKNFRDACKRDKVPQLGADELKKFNGDQAKHNEWFTDFFSQLSDNHYHFICFGYSAPSVIRRLLDKPCNLDNFTVTFIPWIDEVGRPPNGIAPFSKEAYKAVYDKLERSFSFLD